MQKPTQPSDKFLNGQSRDCKNDEPVEISTANCPICKKQAEQRYRPFCTNRCAEIDLGRWLKGQYSIAGTREEADIVE